MPIIFGGGRGWLGMGVLLRLVFHSTQASCLLAILVLPTYSCIGTARPDQRLRGVCITWAIYKGVYIF